MTITKNLDLTILPETKASIQASFDRIARELLTNWSLRVNANLFSFTEIEFYFFLKEIHEDNATHEHNYDQGLWRSHLQGLDITFQSTEISDGGILIRGLKNENNNYVNGPKRVLEAIFKGFVPVMEINQQFGLVPTSVPSSVPVFKTNRHGLSGKQDNLLIKEPYRYYTEIDNWNLKHINKAEKERIQQASMAL